MKPHTNMYVQNVDFPDVFKGCNHDCVYCRKSFQQQAKRQKWNCEKCYTFTPHTHFERMKGKTPTTTGEQFIFFPKGGDLCFAKKHEVKQILEFVKSNPQTLFLIQTKNPKFIFINDHLPLPENVLFGITLETTETTFNTPSQYKNYSEISKAPSPMERAKMFASIPHKNKSVTIEPILEFDMNTMVQTIKGINPKIVYVGYDTKKCKLPEPSLAKTELLMDLLRVEGITVRLKQLREAWY